MPIRNPTDLAAILPRGRRLMGLDLGTKTIGMAVASLETRLATPVGTIRRTRLAADLKELAKSRREWDVGGFVVGLPLGMDGSYGPATDRVRSFAASMIEHAAILGEEPEISFWDERLSTFAVTEAMIEAGVKPGRRAQMVDAAAAAHILQSFLDGLPR